MDKQPEPYHRYWGKAAPTEKDDALSCHLLPFHCLDVAAVGWVLLENNPRLTQRMATGLEMDTERFRHFFVYCLALHDLGKFARSFQGLAHPEGCDLVPAVTGKPYKERHDTLGALIWSETLLTRTLRRHVDVLDVLDEDVEDALELWMGCFFGHHGKPVRAGTSPLEAAFLEEDVEAAYKFTVDFDALLSPNWPLEQLQSDRWRRELLAPMSWQLAGLAVLADWLGSNTKYFRYYTKPIPLGQYWQNNAIPSARFALNDAGLLARPTAVAFPGFTSSFGFQPTPLQEWAERTTLNEGPQLFLVEDITGTGKTEAALTLAHRLLAANRHDGLYFALPTMATSNAMYQRLGKYYRQLYPEGAHSSLVLAHGARHLNDTFTRSVVSEPNLDHSYSPDDESAGIQCRIWLADNRKKALLAEVGVGTIDQALLGVLPRKHQPLRLLGLADKILIVDEVHAYDIYTRTLLCRLLEGHARQGGSAILLSATMPQSLRQELIGAWTHGRGGDCTQGPMETHFPLATHAHDHELVETPIIATSSSKRRLPVSFVNQPEGALGIIVDAALAGQCACWIRNTVDDAISAYQQVCEALSDPAHTMLFHARFAMGDRQRIEEEVLRCFGEESCESERKGRVLIATQVVEQSLDLDFDIMISDLAPIDLVVQRAGRLQRHCRDATGNRLAAGDDQDQRPTPHLYIFAPEWNAEPTEHWVRSTLPGTSFVYSNAQQLWLTCKVLREEGGIDLPERARALLEGVYGKDVPLPEGLEVLSQEHYAGQRTAASGATFNALSLSQGYTLSSTGAGWSDDQEIGTRLSHEPSIQAILVKDDEGSLKPWHNHERHPWAMSMVTLRVSQARRLPDLPNLLAKQAERLREKYPILRWAQFWMPEQSPENGQASYDDILGVRIPRAGEEQTH